MKVNSIDNNKNFFAAKSTNLNNNKNNINFKSSMIMGTLGFTGSLMETIENQGYFLSFLIQDGLGMTLPRTITGFHRDKEVTGKYNFKEGLEVGLREGLTGPFMMAVAPLMVVLTGKFCKSASVNTRIIKTLGDNFKNILKDSKISETVKKDKKIFQKEFYNLTLEKVYKDSVPLDKEPEKTIKYIQDEFDIYVNSKKRKERNKSVKNIINKINDNIMSTSSEFDNLHTLSMDINGSKQTYNAEALLEGIKGYGIDAIERNKYFAELDEKSAENIKNNFATKRLMFNIGAIAATLGGLSLIPKIYAFSNIAPGSVHLADQKKAAENINNNNEQKENVSFKGKGINSDGILSKIGKFLHKNVPDWIKKELEYNRINFTYTLMASLSFFGLLIPRSLRAYNRAFIDENGKRDMTELHEIWLRDSISSLAVVFTVPILQKVFVCLSEKSKGFVLTNRARDKFVDKINPYSKLRLLTNKELQTIYGNIDSKQKMLNFIDFIDKKGGDLQKILSNSEKAKEIFNESTLSLDKIKNENLKDKNKEIKAFFEKLDDNKAKEIIDKLIKDLGKDKPGSIVKAARGFNSIPGFLVTVIISPIILGVLIPMITYSNTRKTHEKMKTENNIA